ncbi:KR domain-containing protein [Xylaria digitata]|nr:KR domain-containing protein [Xylaria digitata]
MSSHSEFRRFSSYSTGSFNSYSSIISRPVDPATSQRSSELTDLSSSLFDLILVMAAQPHIRSFLPQVLSSLAKNALIIILGSRTELDSISSSGVAYLKCPINNNTALFIARQAPAEQRKPSQKHKFLIVKRERSSLESELMHALKAVQGQVARTTLKDLITKQGLPGITIFNLRKLYSPLLSRITDQDMQRVKIMTDKAACLVWVTGGNIIRGCKPNLALAAGLARAVGIEQPSLKFYTYDVDAPNTHVDLMARHILSILNQQGPKPDIEFVQQDSIVHVSQLVPNNDINTLFRNKQGLETTTLSLKKAKDVQLAIRRPSQFESIFFKQQKEPLLLSPNKVRIKVASAGVNAKDFYVLAKRVETKDATSGGVGIAAIELALAASAKVFTTVSTDKRRDYLIRTFGLKPSNIFNSRGTSFLKMGQFSKSTTFTAFDLIHLYYNKDHQSIWHSLLYQVMNLYHQEKIAASMPVRVFDISKAADAFRLFASQNRIGKIAINFKNPDSEIRVHKQKYVTAFHPGKSYVIISCLSGLGRTLTRWIVSRGARKFAFLGRSGLQKTSALNLIQDPNAIGVDSVVITGNVCDQTDVKAVIGAAAALGRIGGIVQAAMGLNEAIFAEMPTSYWHTAIDPKLGFFLMTSSVSGSVGTATKANYFAANYFLDIFARYLRTKKLPGISVGLGMISKVGYLHENPNIKALLLRKSIQPINADNMLQIINLALSSANSMISIDPPYDKLAASHLLTGLEASGIQELPLGKNASNSIQHGQQGDLSAEILKAIKAGQTLMEAVLNHVWNRFANLVLMKPDTMATGKPLEEYGMDSMLGAELRTWLYQTLMVDVPLSMLLGKTCTLKELSDMAAATIERKRTELES